LDMLDGAGMNVQWHGDDHTSRGLETL